MVFTVTGKEPVAHRRREQQKPQTDGQEVTPETAAQAAIHIPHHTLTLSYAWTKGGMGAWRALHFKENLWKDGIRNDQKRKTLTVESP